MYVSQKSEKIDVLTIGEMVVDFISAEQTDWLRNATTFKRYLGGSPTNISVYVSKLGGRSAVISKTGIGAFGKFLKSELQRHGVSTDYLLMDHRTNTSIIFVSSTSGTPDFEEFRSGDSLLRPEEISEEAIEQARVVHSSCFALSREPCRSAVLSAFARAAELGKIVSLDPNYSRRIWPDYKEAKKTIAETYQYVNVTKPSFDDAGRIFGRGKDPETYIELFHEMGPETVVLTMGGKGTLVSENGIIKARVPARKVTVQDATGAGDSFWAGFLVALLDGEPPVRAALFAREVAERKLAQVGPIEDEIDRQVLYNLIEKLPVEEVGAVEEPEDLKEPEPEKDRREAG